MDIRKAELPVRVLRGSGGAEMPWSELVAELASARAVCIGENHKNPHDHWVQYRLVGDLAARARQDQAPWALGMEMFQRPFQGVLDDFGRGAIDEATLLERSGWADRWGYDWALYQPIVAAAVTGGAALIALNVERELTKKVAKQGVDALAASDKAKLPELVTDDPDHRAWWQRMMGGVEGHGAPAEEGGHASDPEAEAMGERIYTAQILWDETMAERASQWLSADERRRMIIMAGNGHCHESAIVRRLERRGVGEVVSVRPIIEDGSGNIADLLANPENDYLVVMSTPTE